MIDRRPPQAADRQDQANGARRGRKHRRLATVRALRRASAGFSLIELLVVISLIIILVALLINAVIENRGPIVETKNTMQALLQAETEYRAKTKKFVDHQDTTILPEPGSGMEKFINTVGGDPDIQKMLSALSDALTDLDGNNYGGVADGWENPIVYRMYSLVPPTGGIPTGDVEWDDLANYGIPQHGSLQRPAPFFASAGKDGKWGDLNAAQDTDEYKWTRDNLYSFELE